MLRSAVWLCAMEDKYEREKICFDNTIMLSQITVSCPSDQHAVWSILSALRELHQT